MFVLSASSETVLAAYARSMADYLKGACQNLNPDMVARTLRRRGHHAHRLAVVTDYT